MRAIGSRNFWFLWRLSCVMWCFSGNCLMRGCFAENRHVVFFWKLPGSRACNVWLKCTLERSVMFGKSLKYNPTDNRLCFCFGSLWDLNLKCFSLKAHGHSPNLFSLISKSTARKKLFVLYSQQKSLFVSVPYSQRCDDCGETYLARRLLGSLCQGLRDRVHRGEL